MKQIGLTGSIGMGKSTTAGMLRRLRIPVFDADRQVHLLMAPGGGAVAAVLDAFPGVGNQQGGIDRKALGARVFGDAPALRRLEIILHPLVFRARRAFLNACARRRIKFVVLDVPLLFEGLRRRREYDSVFLVSAPSMLQRQRVLARPGMTEARFQQVLDHQLADSLKRRLTRHIIETGLGKAHALKRLRHHLRIVDNDSKRGIWGKNARNRLRYGNHRARSRQRRPGR